ncbi:MAG: metallophosphoesterase [Candidatus Sulfobium sp.]
MTLFLLTFFLAYSAVHFYAFLKARAALNFGAGTGIALALFMIIMIAAPFIIRYSERLGFELFARVMAYVGYFWLGILFLFFSCSIALDIYRFVVFAGGLLFQKDLSAFVLSARNAFLIPLVFSLAASAYGYFEAREIRTEHVTIKTSRIPAGTERLRIVQISDVHLGLIVREARLKRILEKVRLARPDILVSTGDLVDGQISRIDGLSGLLREITAKYGKFAVTGNHEFYAGFAQSKAFTEKAGFRLLRAEAVDDSGIVTIAGVDDPTAKAFGLAKKHRPWINKEAAGLFDLQLSGHVHDGQIFPFTIVTWLYYPVVSGLAHPAEGGYLYVSRGSGTWGPPIRFLARPEVTVIDLVHSGRPPGSRK